MRKNSLVPNKGLSLSDAQSVSNLCNQRASLIGNRINAVNNASRKISYEGKEQIITAGVKLPEDVFELILEKCELYACQAFLMENVKAKDTLFNDLKYSAPDLGDLMIPIKPTYAEPNLLSIVGEEWGWEQLSLKEINEYHLVNSYAAHIGKFIHNGMKLSKLRDELEKLPTVEWMEINKDQKTPVTLIKHHESDKLMELHEKFATKHREYEKRVNYFKSKVKNLVTLEVARIASLNAQEQNRVDHINNNMRTDYDSAMVDYNNVLRGKKNELAIKVQEETKRIASMRIEIPQEFKKIVDMFLDGKNK